MGLPAGIWPLFIALLWVVEALPAGGHGNSPLLRNPPKPAIGTAGNPPASDEILHINQELIPPEAPGSSFLLEGDIVKVSPFRVFSSASPKWPKRRGTVQIPYIISYKYDKPSVELIKEAFADFAKFTCIKFVPYSYQRDFISIMPMSGCFSSVGRTGGMQVVSLAPACLRRGKGVTLHELMHVVGFWHEHSRADRDKYIRISWDEILTGFEINFMKSWNSNMLVDYDYSSVMHYGRYAFSMTGLPTITPRSDPDVALGQRWNLSSSDIARVNKLYKCSRAHPEPVLFPESPTESTTQETIMNFIHNEPEPCPTEGEIQVSTSPPGTKPPETGQSARRPSSQMTSTPKAGTKELVDRTPMNVEGPSVSLTPVRGVQPVTFEPTRLSTQGMTYLEATGKPPPPPMEMGTVGAEGKPLIPTGETLLLGTESIKKPDLTTVLVTPLGVAWLSEVTSQHGKAAEGLGTTEVPTEALAGLEFPELVSPARVAPVETGGTKPGEVGLAETTSIQGTELAHVSTYLAQKRPSPATEVGVVTLSSNQTMSLEIPMELATAETTSSSEESSGTYTAAFLFLGPPPPEPGSATETPPLTSTEKWTTNLARLTSAKSITPVAPGRTRSAPTWQIRSGEMETIAVQYATEPTSLLHPIQDWTIRPTKQGNQSASSQVYSPGSHEQSTIVMPLVGMAETEPTELMQPTSLTTSFEMVQNHTIYPVEIGVQGAPTRHQKGPALSSSGIETASVVPPTQATTSMETQTELGFVEATKIKASYHPGSPSLTEGTFFPVTQVKDGEYATEAESLPMDWVSRASEPAEMGMQATKTNYRNKEGVHTNAPFSVGGSLPTAIGLSYTTPSLGASENPITNPPSAGPAEAARSEARNQVFLSTRSPPEMGVQEASNAPPNRRTGLMATPAYVLTPSIAAELRFMEHPTREALGLETPVPQASRPSELVATGVSPAWTEAKDQFSSSGTREATLLPMSSATEQGHCTQSLESASLPEVEIKEHRVRYRTGAGLVTLTPPQSRARIALMPSVEMPELTVPEKVTPVHTTSSPRKWGRGEISMLTPTGKAPAIEKYLEPSKVTSTTGHLETQSISPTELATMKIPFSQREASSTEELNLPVTGVGYGQSLEALTKTTTQAGLQEVQRSPRKPHRVPIPGEGTKAMYIMPSQERPEALVTHPSTGTANRTSIGASLQDTSPVSMSTEMNGQEAPSSHELRNGGHPYTITPVGMGPVTKESERGGHPTKGTLVGWWIVSPEHGSRATETTAPSLLNTEEGTPSADTATEVVHSTRGVLLPEAPENQTVSVREVAMEEARSYREEGGLSTTHPLPSDTISTETAEQVQSTQVNEQMLPETSPTSHPEQGTGKPTPNTVLTGGENTSLPSLGGMSSLEAVTHWLDLAAGTSLQEASPHQTFSPTELQIKTINSQETPTMILHGEDYGQTPTSPEGMVPAEMEALELIGLFTKTVSTQSPEITPQRLEEISVFHRKTGRGKPSPLSLGTLSAEKETVLASSTKIALGMEALAGQTTGQTELGITEVSGSQLLGSPAAAERTSAPGAEATGAENKFPSNGTETPAILPGETREPIPTARTPSAGTEATGQSYSTTVGTTVKAAETPSSPSERRGYITTSGYRKKNGEQAHTHSPIGSISSAGSDASHASPFMWPPYYQTALASTKPGKTPMESGAPSPAGRIPSGEVAPTYMVSNLESQPASPPGRGNGGKYTPSAEGGVTPVGHWDLGNDISTLERRSSLSKKWALNTTLANGGLSIPQAQMLRETRPTSSAVGVMPTLGAKEAHGIKVTQLKRAFRKRPNDLSAVDLHKELLHLVGKRSLPDAAPRHDSDPDLRGITLTHGHQKMQSPLLSNTPRKLRVKALEAFPKQHVLLPALKEIKSPRNTFETGTSESAPDHTRGLLRPKERLLALDKPSAAPLPRRQSDSGKHPRHILPAQRATAQPGWQICDFEKDLCRWQQSDADDFDWILAGERPSAGPAMGGNISEEPHSSPSGGGYISLKSASARRPPGQKTSLISPILRRLGCIHFWYSPLGSVMGTINLYLKLAEAPEWHRIWFAEGQQGTDWRQVSVEASESQKLQVMVEGVVGPDVGSDVGIDDLAVCEAECRGGCDELMALYEK